MYVCMYVCVYVRHTLIVVCAIPQGVQYAIAMYKNVHNGCGLVPWTACSRIKDV